MAGGGPDITTSTTATPPPETPRIRAIKRAYLANELPVGDIARAFGTTRPVIYRLAEQHGWPMRRPGKSHSAGRVG